jgi:hypothetical protein
MWERDNADTANGGKPLPAREYCKIKYTSDSVSFQEWGPGRVIDKRNPEPTTATKANFKHPTKTLNDTLNDFLDIHSAVNP